MGSNKVSTLKTDGRRIETLSEKEEKTEPEDNDIMLLGNNNSSSYRKITFANIANSIKAKIRNWIFDNLNTSDKTIIGAINELSNNTSKYLPLTGGTLTNTGSSILGLTSDDGNKNTATGMEVTSWSDNAVSLHVGSGGTNRGLYDSTNNDWIIYRDSNKDVYLNTPKGTVYKPYYEAGDTISVSLHTAGFVSSSATVLYFLCPLSMPIIGSPSRTVSGTLTIRQNNAYCYGSSSSVTVSPSSWSSSIIAGGLRISATFDNTTNVTNNSPIGVAATLTIVLS